METTQRQCLLVSESSSARGRGSGVVLGVVLLGAWSWAIWSCVEDWRFHPQYSFGWVVPFLAAYFAWRRWGELPDGPLAEGVPMRSGRWFAWGALLVAAAVPLVELMRQELYGARLVIWLICILAVVLTIGWAWRLGGAPLGRCVAFPSLFFLSAVPWPSLLENRITLGLKMTVALVTTEVLHWLGISARAQGAVIEMNSGLVGIDEACSGVRSLQTGLMVGLAIGELFRLSLRRRAALLGIALALAVGLNLTRTLVLCWIVERGGMPALDRYHEPLGIAALLLLPVLIWGAGHGLKTGGIDEPRANERPRWRDLRRRLSWEGVPELRPALALALAGFFGCQLWLGALESQGSGIEGPEFMLRRNLRPGDELVSVPAEVLRLLRPASGEYIRRRSADLPLGIAESYHFYWRPSARNNFVLLHRPDVCMPAGGWKLAGPVEPVELEWPEGRLRWYAFEFAREPLRAFMLWGVWRNGEPVDLDFRNGGFDPGVSLSWSVFRRKPRPALEIVCCILIYREGAQPLEQARRTLAELFDHRARSARADVPARQAEPGS